MILFYLENAQSNAFLKSRLSPNSMKLKAWLIPIVFKYSSLEITKAGEKCADLGKFP